MNPFISLREILYSGYNGFNPVIKNHGVVMSFRFKRKEKVSTGIKRMVVEEIDSVLDLIRLTSGDHTEAIHDSRRSLKKIRAVVRLIRDELGEKLYKQENHCFRDAARKISSLRDSAVLVTTLEKIKSDFKNEIDSATIDNLLEQLRERHKELEQDILHDDQAFHEVGEILQEARERVLKWPLRKNRFSILSNGIKRIYRQGKSRFKEAFQDVSDEALHECRKRLKDLRYQVNLLEPVWPRMMSELSQTLDETTDILGDDHDLSVLKKLLQDGAKTKADPVKVQRLIEIIDLKRKEFQAQALPMGERIFAESPISFAERIESYWDTFKKYPLPKKGKIEANNK